MTYPKAIVLAAAFIAAAVIYVNQPAHSTTGLTGHARYQIGGVSQAGFIAWAIDTWTGQVSFCAATPSGRAPSRCASVPTQWTRN